MGDHVEDIDRAGLDQPLPARGEFRRTLQILVNLMTNALEGYAVLKVAGKGAGLDSLRQMLSARFNRSKPVASGPVSA